MWWCLAAGRCFDGPCGLFAGGDAGATRGRGSVWPGRWIDYRNRGGGGGGFPIPAIGIRDGLRWPGGRRAGWLSRTSGRQPENAVAVAPFLPGQLAQPAVSRQQYPGSGFGKGEDEAVRQRQRAAPPPVVQCKRNLVSVELFHRESQREQGGAAVIPEFLPAKQAGHGECEWKVEASP